MAEIRSTLDMVMERAAKMAADAPEATMEENTIKEGMRIAADYLNKTDGSIQETIAGFDDNKKSQLIKGMAETLLRNVVLPRDEMLQANSSKALSGLGELVSGQASQVCSELDQLLGQYNQHKEQMIQQLEEAIRSQLEQKLMQQGTQITEDMSINPRMHPQYQEELDKMLTDLNGQYNQALEQRKEIILQNIA